LPGGSGWLFSLALSPPEIALHRGVAEGWRFEDKKPFSRWARLIVGSPGPRGESESGDNRRRQGIRDRLGYSALIPGLGEKAQLLSPSSSRTQPRNS
jgi:hypothetical protein